LRFTGVQNLSFASEIGCLGEAEGAQNAGQLVGGGAGQRALRRRVEAGA